VKEFATYKCDGGECPKGKTTRRGCGGGDFLYVPQIPFQQFLTQALGHSAFFENGSFSNLLERERLRSVVT
jgi:hypothetical protein